MSLKKGIKNVFIQADTFFLSEEEVLIILLLCLFAVDVLVHTVFVSTASTVMCGQSKHTSQCED